MDGGWSRSKVVLLEKPMSSREIHQANDDDEDKYRHTRLKIVFPGRNLKTHECKNFPKNHINVTALAKNDDMKFKSKFQLKLSENM